MIKSNKSDNKQYNTGMQGMAPMISKGFIIITVDSNMWNLRFNL